MGYSDVEIVNQALDHIGKDTITSLSDSTAQARKASAAFERTLHEVLSRSHWTFSRKFRSLAGLTNDWEERWDYKYDLPNDMATAVRLVPLLDTQHGDPIPYKLMGGSLYTNATPAKLEYVWSDTDTMAMPQPFLTSVSFCLARNIAMPLTRKLSIWKDMNSMYEYTLGLAIEHDSGQEPTSYADDQGGAWAEARGASSVHHEW